MLMGLFSKIREHAAVASGNFASMFKEVEIPPLPAAVARLVAEFNKPEPDVEQLTSIISADLELSAKVMRTVNSSMYGLRGRIKSVRHAITLLGLDTTKSVVLCHTMKAAIPNPRGGIFEHESFWTDSLLRALLARSLTRRYLPGEEDDAFTTMLLSDVALPVLLLVWQEYYAPIVEQWRSGNERLSEIERNDFGWDHAQAGAWILKSWGFLDETVSLAGAHNLTIAQVLELGLDRTVALPLATASMLPSVLRPSEERARLLVETTQHVFALSAGEFADLVSELQVSFGETREQFGLGDGKAGDLLTSLISLSESCSRDSS